MRSKFTCQTSYLSVLDFWNLYFTKLIFELDFCLFQTWIFTACVACKNQVQNRQKIKSKNQVQKSILWNRDLKNQVEIDRGKEIWNSNVQCFLVVRIWNFRCYWKADEQQFIQEYDQKFSWSDSWNWHHIWMPLLAYFCFGRIVRKKEQIVWVHFYVQCMTLVV